MTGTPSALRTREDHVVLVDTDGTPSGVAPRATVHTQHTPLHLAFSCYLVSEDGLVLLTRRALAKRTWPGVWTNSFCGHPRQGETFPEAIARHARHELGMTVGSIQEVLPDFRYRAVDASGVVENEICPVFVATALDAPEPNPDEVMDLAWVAPAQLASLAASSPWILSPWTAAQVPQLGGTLQRVPVSTS